METRRIRPSRKLAVLGVAALALLAACVPDPPGPTPPTADGDGFKRTSASLTTLRAEGFAFTMERIPPGDVRMQLLRQRLDPMVDGAVTQLNFHTGLAFGRAGAAYDHDGNFNAAVPFGQIRVSIVTPAEMATIAGGGCSAPNTIGCAGVSTSSNGRVLSGRIAILDEHIVAATDQHLATTVLHEAGHALNLSHYNAVYQGELQTMHHQGGNRSGDYRQGDRNGLNWMAAGSLAPAARALGENPNGITVHDFVQP